MKKTQLFISYCHKDREYLDRLFIHLKPLQKEGLIDVWADTQLKAGDRWRIEIKQALDRASVAILLLSADFLASDFITENELPPLLKKAQQQGTRIIPVILKPCRFTRDKNLQQFQPFNDPKATVVRMTAGKQEKLYDALAEEVEKHCRVERAPSKVKSSTVHIKNVPAEKEYVNQINTGYCIRCHKKLSFNLNKPLCKDCYYEWSEFENEDYEEDYCHYCGKEKKVTFVKPICYTCYKKIYQ